MARTAQLATPYALPYRVAVQAAPLLRGGRTVVLRVTPARPLTTELQQELDATVTAFAILARTGALAASAATVVSSTSLEWSLSRVTGNHLEWEFNLCELDERAAVLLAQFFLTAHAACPLSSVVLATPVNAASAMPLPHDPKLRNPYPDAVLTPFPLHLDPDLGTDVSLYLQFARDLIAEEQEEVDGIITEWATAAAMGCYGVAPVPPASCTLLFDEAVTFLDGECEWHMQRFRAHPAALLGLVNVCTALHFRSAPISEMRLE